MLSQEDFRDLEGVTCPNCEGTAIEYGGVEPYGYEAEEYCHCLECGSSWTIVYIIDRYEDLIVEE